MSPPILISFSFYTLVTSLWVVELKFSILGFIIQLAPLCLTVWLTIHQSVSTLHLTVNIFLKLNLILHLLFLVLTRRYLLNSKISDHTPTVNSDLTVMEFFINYFMRDFPSSSPTSLEVFITNLVTFNTYSALQAESFTFYLLQKCG